MPLNRAGRGDTAAPVTRFEPLVTAAEAYPALEREFLSARRRIIAGFRIFDLRTRLRSAEAREIGVDWFDLLQHTLSRGVAVRLILSDFDPIGGAELHRFSWRARRQLSAVAELAERSDLRIANALHGASAQPVPRVILSPVAQVKLRQVVRDLQDEDPGRRARFLTEMPALRPLISERGEALSARLCVPALYPATHHQKLAVIDSERLYIGGLDLDERRFDTGRHDRPAERTWHDVQALVEGPVVEAAERHLDTMLDTVAAKAPPTPRADGFLRTLSRKRRKGSFYLSPRTVVREIEHAHLRGVRQAENLIYFETQFFRHVPLARALAGRVRRAPGLGLIIVLPAAPEDVAFENSSGSDARFGEFLQTKCLRILRQAFGRNLLVLSPVQPRTAEDAGNGQRDHLRNAPLIYVHSKVSIFDDHSAILSSANLNGRSMRWDTEAGVELRDKAHIARLREKVMGHWLPHDATDAYLAPGSVLPLWRDLAETNSEAAPEDRRGFLVRYDSKPARELGMPAPGFPEELV